VNSFLWKYVDMSITKTEWIHLTHKHIHDQQWVSFLKRFEHIFTEDGDLYNYSFVLSNIEHSFFVSFMVFYTTNIQRCLKDIEYCTISTIGELIEFVDTDDEKFTLLLISLYYYF
jgi:hypothetical protein